MIVFDGQVVARGMNAVEKPAPNRTRHTEMEALRSLPPGLRDRWPEMTLYTRLEPCWMCTGAILLYRIGRLVYGSADPYGGGGVVRDSMPTFFKDQFASISWEGPALPSECDPLYKRLLDLEGVKIIDALAPPEVPGNPV